MITYDRVVLGVGGIGSAALWQLAQRGVRVLGIERFGVAHDRGSSHGQTRIIRQAYFEHPAYVPLIRRAYELWRQLERETGQSLFSQVGILEIGSDDGELIQGIDRSAALHQLPVEHLTAAELTQRFPLFHLPEGMSARFEPTAGVLAVEACVAAQIEVARRQGADLWTNTTVDKVEWGDDSVTLRTSAGVVRTEGLVICAGAWSPALFAGQLPLQAVRKHLHWYATHDPQWHAARGCPAFLCDTAQGYFYGFPAFDASGVKVAEHSGGERVVDPSSVDRTTDPVDEGRVREFVREYLINVSAQRLHHAVCLYTLTPDRHFIVDFHPARPRTVIAAGLSGHGFKFAPALGEALADLSMQGATQHPIEFLSARRFRS